MEYALDLDVLKKLIKEKKTGGVEHKRGNVRDILPFSSSKKTKIVKESFHKVIGKFTRLITNMELVDKSKSEYFTFYGNSLIDRILDVVESENDDIRFDFARFLDNFLFKNGKEIKPIHPHFFNLIPLSEESQKKEEIKVAQFMKTILIKDDEVLKEIFKNDGGDDILTNLILNNLDSLKERQTSEDKNYGFEKLMENISELYHQDLLYLSKYPENFLNSFTLLTHFYYFLYIYQLVLKLEQFEKADFSSIDPLYYALDWEPINKRRKPADEMEGFKRIKELESHLFVHVHTLSQLSHNSFNIETISVKPIMTYPKISSILFQNGEEAINSFLNSLKEWLREYTTKAGISYPIDNIDTIGDGFRGLFNCLKEGMSSEVCKNYGKKVEDAAGNVFLKQRGSLGLTLNITQEFLMLLTAVCVKDKRIPLNKLFDEYKKRGVLFDRHSQKEIVQLFDKLNIIDKKSDSGDAQYVKPIL
jgi:DNA phosphorothioation-dependent restriction protein DptG